MAIHTITGTATFSSQANRDAARTRVNTALLIYTYVNASGTIFTSGITHPTTTTITFALQIETNDDDEVRNFRRAIYDALTAANRHTSGWLSSNKVG
jgi:hypothetical protein